MSVSVFNFDSQAVRTVTDDATGEALFVAKDVCAVLGYKDPTTAVRSHCRGVQKLRPILDSLGRTQEVRILTEPDVLRLIVSSTLPAAERFEKWVFEEVLPSIRKTGQYAAPKAKRTYTKSVPFGQELRAVLDLALELRYSTFERNQAVIALLERPGYETLLATLPDRFKQPSPQDEIPDMALAGYANVTWHEATTTWRVAIGLPQGAAVPQIYVYCDKLSDAIQVAAGLQHNGCSTLPGDLVSTRSSLTGLHNAARRTLRSCGVAEVTVRNDGQYPGLVQVTRH